MTQQDARLPKIFRWILRRLSIYEFEFSITGDFESEYADIRRARGALGAFLWLSWSTIQAVFCYSSLSLYWSFVMIKNYWKVAFRTMQRNKMFSAINIAGLAIGLTCVVLLVLWIQDEVNYDQFHKDIDRIYLTTAHVKKSDVEYIDPASVPGVGPLLEDVFPEIEESSRFLYGARTYVFRYKDKTFSENRVYHGDPESLALLTFPLTLGDPETALRDPNSIVLSERKAKKYFGNEDPVGKIITLNNEYPMTVTGVMKEIPGNSTFRFDMITPLVFHERLTGQNLDSLNNENYFVFVRLQANVSVTALNEKIRTFYVDRMGDAEYVPVLRPFARFHLHRLDEGGGSILQVRMVGFMAAFILLIACINFMNLTTARSSKRAKEIGMRKVIGAVRRDIVKQFYFETVLLVVFATIAAALLVRLLLPSFNRLFLKQLTLNIQQNPTPLWILLSAGFVTVLLAGSYPALVMSSFLPIRIIKGFSGTALKKTVFRRILVMVQFTLAIGLIAGAGGVYNQLTYLQNMDLGYSMDNILYFSNRGELKGRYDTVKNEFLGVPGVAKVTTSSNYFPFSKSTSSAWQWEGKDPTFKPSITWLTVDSDFLDTFDIELLDGDPLWQRDDFTGTTDRILINKKLAGLIGQEDVIGIRLSYSDRNYVVVGVVEDIIPNPRWRVDEPLVFLQNPQRFNFVYIKIRSDNMMKTLAGIQEIFERVNPSFPFEYEFMDDDYKEQFNFVRRTRALGAYSAILAVFVSCLGLFGLAAFNSELRTKEVGIRKVLGSSVSRIVMLLSKELSLLVLMANVIAWPVTWYLITQWEKDFLHQAPVNIWIFPAAGAIAFVVALLTVGYQSAKAATANPIISLRYE
jgi:ABC-type antimicrobial peptide transport system permease subunit